MSDVPAKPVPAPHPTEETGAALLTAGGIAAAFGAASCCALPMLLGPFGLGSAWLFGVALLAAPHRTVLLAAAAICLAGGAILLWRRRTAAASYAPGAACPSNPALRYVTSGGLAVGGVLLVLGYAYA